MKISVLGPQVLLVLALFTVHAAVLGCALGARLGLWPAERDAAVDNRYLQAFFAIGLGLVIDTALLFALGLLGLFRPGTIGLVGALAFAVGLLGARGHLASEWQRARRLPLSQWLPQGLMVALVFATIALRAFQVPGLWDDTMYHLPLARGFVEQHGIEVNEFLRFPLFPANANLLLALGLLCGGDVMAQAFAALPVFLIFLGLVGATVWLTDSLLLGLLATLLLLALRPVDETLGYAYVDNTLGFFVWAAVLAVAQASVRPHGARGWLFTAGLLAGAAIGTKYFGMVMVAMLVAAQFAWRRDWRQSAWLIAGIVLSGAWWYVRSFVVSGDPVHPAGGHLFGFYLWDAADLLGQKQEQATHGVPPMSFNFWVALQKAGAVWIAPAFLSLLFVRRAPAPVCLMQVLLVGYVAFWFFVTQVERYLAPIYGLSVFLGVYALHRAGALLPWPRVGAALARWQRPWLAGLVALVLVVPPFVRQATHARENLRNWPVAQRERAGYELLAAANEEAATRGRRLLQIGYENGFYYFDGVMIGDWFGPGRYRAMLDCTGTDGCALIKPGAMKALMARFDCHMLAVNTERFKLDLPAYEREFDVVRRSRDGVLLAPKR